MKECNAWCQPERGLHVSLDRVNRCPGPATIEFLRQTYLGTRGIVGPKDQTCVPMGAEVEVIAIDPASEVDRGDWDIAVLITEQVIV